MKYHFRHYSNTRNELNMLGLIYKYGCKGYGWYWMLTEMLCEEPMHKMPMHSNAIARIAECLQSNVDTIKEFIQYCIEAEILATDGEFFWSKYLERSKIKPCKNRLTERIETIDVRLWREIQRTIFERDNYTCLYCGKRGGKLEVDHKIPLSRGGTNAKENLVTSCRTCNRQKRDKTVEEFFAWRVANA